MNKIPKTRKTIEEAQKFVQNCLQPHQYEQYMTFFESNKDAVAKAVMDTRGYFDMANKGKVEPVYVIVAIKSLQRKQQDAEYAAQKNKLLQDK